MDINDNYMLPPIGILSYIFVQLEDVIDLKKSISWLNGGKWIIMKNTNGDIRKVT